MGQLNYTADGASVQAWYKVHRSENCIELLTYMVYTKYSPQRLP